MIKKDQIWGRLSNAIKEGGSGGEKKTITPEVLKALVEKHKGCVNKRN
ncbi:MAG: hypothetical protein RSD88_03320 [Anaerovoracaceae bacterium]